MADLWSQCPSHVLACNYLWAAANKAMENVLPYVTTVSGLVGNNEVLVRRETSSGVYRDYR